MSRFLAVVSLFLLSFSSVALAASSCITFDEGWNLLALNYRGKDYNVGKQDTWNQGSPTDITTSGRPSFNGTNISCYFSQFTNAIYVLGADSSNSAVIYIYDATANSWSAQSVNAGEFDPNDFAAVLDHDTNVFYAYSKGKLFALDMELLKAANSTTKEWTEVEQVDWDTTNYQPTMALAQNHVHFLGVPGVPDGSAKIFVIHFAFMQPDPQRYGDFPNTHGQTASLFKDMGVQTKFAFIPDDATATYIIDVTTNKTETLKGPTQKDRLARYSASTSALLQLTPSGDVSYITFDQEPEANNAAADWVQLHIATADAPGTGSGPIPSGTTTGAPGVPSSSRSNVSNAAETIGTVGRWSWGIATFMAGAALF